MADKVTWLGTTATKLPPTRKHRTAVWECMLATVYARNDAGEVRYFDYDWDAALAFAGVTPERDPRVAKASFDSLTGARYADMPRARKRTALFILA